MQNQLHEIKFNFTSAKEQVPEAERNNRIIKERVRAGFHRLPYKTIPKLMTQILVMDSKSSINLLISSSLPKIRQSTT